MKKSFWFPTLHTILCKFVTIIMFAFLSFLFLSLSSDVNDDCCSGCQYANSSTVCMEYAPGNIQCLENITCTGSDKKCPVSQFSYVPVESPCRVDGKCYPPDSECSRYTHTHSNICTMQITFFSIHVPEYVDTPWKLLHVAVLYTLDHSVR